MNYPELDFIFYPESVAVVGMPGDLSSFNAATLYVEGLVKAGFKGNIYPVGPGGGEVFGLKVHKTIKDVPGKIDYVISAIPARHAPQLIIDSAAKRVRTIHFFTSGFGEIENSHGKQLQDEIINLARSNGIRIVGPNCLGVYCPSSGMTFKVDFEAKCGSIAMISQSGGNATHCIHEGQARGLHFSKVVSMGNGADLNESDYLEYLTHDPETKIITAYIEGVKHGLRFLKALKAAAKIKPVLVFKVGASAVGAEAAASHTTALAGSSRVWEALLKQAGAIMVSSIEQMIDVAGTFLRMPAPAGRDAVVLGVGGGASVIIADELTAAGINLPRFSKEARGALIDIAGTEAGRIFKNPVDLNRPAGPDSLLRTIEAVKSNSKVDFFLVHVAFDHFGLITPAAKEFLFRLFLESLLVMKDKIGKPVAVILHSYSSSSSAILAADAHEKLIKNGFMVYTSIQRAAVALNKFLEYHERLRAHQDT